MTTREILQAIPRLSALVVGDICLDRWCSYDPAAAEASRETGIARIAVTSTQVTPGAGGTVANNLVALGAGRVAILGVVGEDGFGFELRRALDLRGIEGEMLVGCDRVQTFTYTKLLNAVTGQEDLPRVDFINTRPLPQDVEARVMDTLRAFAPDFDVVIVSDQAETEQGGVVTAGVRAILARLAADHPQKIVWVDSRRRIELFRNVLAKPNQREADEACQRLFGRTDYAGLRRVIGERPLVVTHGGEGACIWDNDGATFVPTRKVERPVDICGAGDSFSAGAALALAICGSLQQAVRFGHLVSSVTIMQKGTGTASPEEVLAAELRQRD